MDCTSIEEQANWIGVNEQFRRQVQSNIGLRRDKVLQEWINEGKREELLQRGMQDSGRVEHKEGKRLFEWFGRVHGQAKLMIVRNA